MIVMHPARAPVRGNAEKYERYQRAHQRLTQAIEYGFYIEAAMICESLLADRLHSHLHWRVYDIQLHPAAFYGKAAAVVSHAPDAVIEGKQAFVPFGVLIGMYAKSVHHDHRPDHPTPPRWATAKKTVSPATLKSWAEERNAVAHGAVKTHPTRRSYEQNFDEFQRRAEVCADNGKTLVRLLTDWDRAVRVASTPRR